jgi:hypothetical protein
MNNYRVLLTTAFLILGSLSCQQGNTDKTVQMQVIHEYLDHFAKAKEKGKILISDETSDQNYSKPYFYKSSIYLGKLLQKLFPTIRQDTIDSYIIKNAKPQSLRNKLALKNPYELLPQKNADLEIEKITSEDNLYNPDRSIKCVARISRVGVSDNDEQALIYIEFYFGHNAARGGFIFLIRSKDGWRISHEGASWLS